jgi:sucrose-6-phosphate hydrolase SacC (GH32 family)
VKINNKKLLLHIHSSLEVFVGEGEQVVTNRIYLKQSNNKVYLKVNNDSLNIEQLEVWDLKDIWGKPL